MQDTRSYFVDLLGRAAAAIPFVAKHAVLAAFEPKPVTLKSRPANVAAVSRAILGLGHDEFVQMKSPKGRNDFLVAAQNHLRCLKEHEELLVAFGRRKGATRSAASRLTHLWRGKGTADRVDFTPALLHALENASRDEAGSVLLVHNHPKFDVKTLFSMIAGWTPLPSSTDRMVALHYNLNWIKNVLTGRGGATMRWYLVDEGHLAEFYLPPVEFFEGILSGVLGAVGQKERKTK